MSYGDAKPPYHAAELPKLRNLDEVYITALAEPHDENDGWHYDHLRRQYRNMEAAASMLASMADSAADGDRAALYELRHSVAWARNDARNALQRYEDTHPRADGRRWTFQDQTFETFDEAAEWRVEALTSDQEPFVELQGDDE